MPATNPVWDRVARFYDVYTGPMEMMGGKERRRQLLAGARGKVLEVGIGTGFNLPHYPDGGMELTGIDISGAMLERARKRAEDVGREVDLHEADIERLPYADDTFDTVTSTCVFCSVADPVAGLREVARVVKPDGEVRLLEHVRPENPVMGKVFDLLTPLTRLMGPEINRRTVENVEAAGMEIVSLKKEGIWREIVARQKAS